MALGNDFRCYKVVQERRTVRNGVKTSFMARHAYGEGVECRSMMGAVYPRNITTVVHYDDILTMNS